MTHFTPRNVVLSALVLAALHERAGLAQVTTVLPLSEPAIAAALHPSGLTITSVRVRNGAPQQIGSFANFSAPPVTLADGLVMSTGSVGSIGHNPMASDPAYDPANPPPNLSTAIGSGRTGEFHAYGQETGAIVNYDEVHDVASIEVTFDIAEDTNVKFDYVFGSIEYPVWTSSFTDAFLAFVDTKVPESQVCFDSAGSAIQVGWSFADLVTTSDANTAFAAPHGMIRNLTTTTPLLRAGRHTIWFEVGDVNDEIIDSAVFITNLRAEAGTAGTVPSDPDDCPGDFDGDGVVDGSDLGALLADWGARSGQDLTGDGTIDGADLGALLSVWGPCAG